MRATPTTTWRASSRRKRGRAPSRPCCTASPAAASWPQRAIALGLYISFTGILTFKKSDELRAIAAELPADRLLVETDAPYLAPGRYRGKRNEPAYVVETAKVLAEARGVSARRDGAADHRQFLPPVPQGPAGGRRGPACAGCARRMTLTFTILGCGSSGGVPRPALGWGACDPDNPKNRRRRCSLLVERRNGAGVTRVLVDTSPDLREQLLDAEVDWLDAVLYTHEHADHTHGIDDLRALFMHRRRAARRLSRRADRRRRCARASATASQSPPGSDYPPIVTEHRMAPGETVTVDGEGGAIAALPVLQEHGDIASLGFRFGGLAYSCDLSGLPADERAGARRASTSGSSTRCATGRIRAISASTRRWPGSSASSRGARS